MKLLTETQKGVLQGHTGGLNLPSGASIYLAQGLPTLFKLAGTKPDVHHPLAWLHIPGELLTSIRHSLIVQASNLQFNYIASAGIESDDVTLYPVLISSQVRAVITVAAGATLELSPTTQDAILVALLSRYSTQDQCDHQKLLGDFLACLFNRDRSYDRFQKALLELMTKQWPGTLGAVYFESEGVHKLRLAVGDIHLSDRLEGTLKSSTAENWSEAMRREQFFVPADMTPNYPEVTGHPPSYMFVHPGIGSDLTEYMLVVAMPGDIGAGEVAALRQIAHLAGHIHESQFSTTSDVVSLYGHLAGLSTAAPDIPTMLLKAFRVVRRQMPLSRIVLTVEDGPVEVVTAKGDDEPTVRTASESPLPVDPAPDLKENNPLLVPDVRREPSYAGSLELYLSAEVSSAIIFALDSSPAASAYVAFGSPLAGQHLQSHRTLLDAVVVFLSLCQSLSPDRRHRDHLIGSALSDNRLIVTNQRLNTVARLAGGYFHDLMEHLSVVVGQNEIIESAISAEDIALASRAILSGSSKVRKAADRIAAYLGNLRNLCLLTTERLGQRLSCRRLFEDLPIIVSGFARQVKDSKNVTLNIKTRSLSDSRLELTYQELYDYVLPLVMGLMGEAIGSGVLLVSAGDGDGRLLFEFSADIIGHTDLGEMLGRTYPHGRLHRLGDNDGVVHLENACMEFSVNPERLGRVVIHLAQAPDGPPSDGKPTRRREGTES
jgi:hypothetical protein